MPITEKDEYLIQQAADTVDLGVNEDPDFMDRLYFGCHNPEGTLFLVAGLGTYPNINIMDGYVIVRQNAVQHNLRLSRHLQGDPATTRQGDPAITQLGPLSIKVIEPLKRWGVHLGDNDYGIGCSLEFEGRISSYGEKAPQARYYGHYNQMGQYKGSITIGSQQFNVDGFVGARDRSRRRKQAGQGGAARGHFFVQVHFPGSYLTLVYAPLWDGTFHWCQGAILNDDGSEISIVDMSHRIEFMPTVRALTRVEMVLKDANGKERHVTARPISPAIYLNGGGYVHQGDDRGPFNIEGEQWDVSQPPGIDSPRFGFHEYIAEFQLDGETGVGILEASYSPDEKHKYEPTL